MSQERMSMDSPSSSGMTRDKIDLPLVRRSVFFVFLIPPLLGLLRLSSISPKLTFFFAIYLIFVNILTTELYQHDKKQSRIMGWRISENRLHFFELIGGWPAAFISQELFRHKTRKVSYQVVFLLIVLLHDFLWIKFII